MKYLIIGAGGTGGCIAGYLAAGGRDVSIIARGAHLDAIRRQGLSIIGSRMGDIVQKNVKSYTEEEYQDTPDVIFVCVKSYSLDSVIPFLNKAAAPHTVIIPVLNRIGTGAYLTEKVPNAIVLDGCIYVSASITAPGEITQVGERIRVIFGMMDKGDPETLKQIEQDLKLCDISVVVSDHIERDIFRKFILVSAMGAAGSYYGCDAGDLQHAGEMRRTFCSLTSELVQIAAALEYTFPVDMVEAGLKNIDASHPHKTTSMQKDIARGGENEINELIFEPVRMGRKLGVRVPTYEKIAAYFGFEEAQQ